MPKPAKIIQIAVVRSEREGISSDTIYMLDKLGDVWERTEDGQWGSNPGWTLKLIHATEPDDAF